MSHHIVEVDDLRHRYADGTEAVRGISFRIEHGESVAIVGANGAGKSTLLLHLNGYLTPSAGKVRIGDFPPILMQVVGPDFEVLRREARFVAEVLRSVGGTADVAITDTPGMPELQIKVDPSTGLIQDARFKTYGCGSAIASSSLVTEWVKGKTLDQALTIKNTQIAEELALPPVKIHCSILAEDAIKAAVQDYQTRHGAVAPAADQAG